MILWFAVFLIGLRIAFANPVPSSLMELSVLSSSVEIADDSISPMDAYNAGNIECDPDTSAVNYDGISQNDQDGNIVRRRSTVCPPTGHIMIPWKIPSREAPSASPSSAPPDSPIDFPDSENPCKIPTQQTLLSCAGPEVWYRTIMELAINCIPGQSILLSTLVYNNPFWLGLGIEPEIPARGRWVHKTNLAQYCCKELADKVNIVTWEIDVKVLTVNRNLFGPAGGAIEFLRLYQSKSGLTLILVIGCFHKP